MKKTLAKFVVDKSKYINEVSFINARFMSYIFNKNESIKSNDTTLYTLDTISSMCASSILADYYNVIKIYCINKYNEDVIINCNKNENTVEFLYLDDYNMKYEEEYQLNKDKVTINFNQPDAIEKFDAALIIFGFKD